MRHLIERLAQSPHTRVENGPSAWTITVSKRPDLTFEVTVPHDVLEWFVEARDATGRELWADWMDYAGYVPKRLEDPKALTADMQHDIEWFVSTLAAAEDFRVTTQRYLVVAHRTTAEWCLDGRWQPVSMAAPAGPTDPPA